MCSANLDLLVPNSIAEAQLDGDRVYLGTVQGRDFVGKAARPCCDLPPGPDALLFASSAILDVQNQNDVSRSPRKVDFV